MSIAGIETRGNSAVDIALWDLFGKAAGRPVCEVLGGRARESIRTYNTCAGYKYIRDGRAQAVANWHAGEQGGPYEDLEAFLGDAGELAQSLLEQGITGMKIWPFDIAAERSRGWDITPAELDLALEPFRRIRQAVGNRMDIMVEFHSLWSLPMACRLAQRLAEFETYWHEDPFRVDNLEDHEDLCAPFERLFAPRARRRAARRTPDPPCFAAARCSWAAATQRRRRRRAVAAPARR